MERGGQCVSPVPQPRGGGLQAVLMRGPPPPAICQNLGGGAVGGGGVGWRVEGGGAQYGRVAASALGSGRACPATVIAFCPSCQLVARPLSVRRTGIHPSTLPPLATLAVRALLG